MATWYVDGTNGSDSNDGTTAILGGGHGPVATIAKAIGASGLAASGDTVYIAPKAGGYRETVTVGVTPTSELKVIGDVRRSKGWAASTPNGPVLWSGWTTNDYSAGSSSALLNTNGKNFLTFEDLLFASPANPTVIDALSVTGSHDLVFRRCVVIARPIDAVFGFSYKGTALTDPNLTFDSCIFLAGATSFSIDCPLHASTNYTATVTVKNCLFYGITGTRGIEVQSSGAGTGKPQGPWTIAHCTFAGNYSSGGIDPRNGNWATGAIKVYSCLGFGVGVFSGNNATVFTSDRNRIWSGATIGASPVGNNDMGGSSFSVISPGLWEMGQSMLWGLPPRPFFSPTPGSPVNASTGQNSAALLTNDMLSRPRPAGGFVPGFEAATTVTGTATSGSTASLTKTGAGWTTNQFVGYLLTITGGTGSGQRRWVASNTATVLTVNYAFLTAPDATSTFSLDPPGLDAAPGCYDGFDTYLPGGSANADGATGNCLEMIGPGNTAINVAVPASAVVVSVKVKWDSNHGDTNKPRAIMVWQPAIGVDDAADTVLKYHEIKTATGTAGSGYETLSFSSITPTAAGFVKIILQSRSATANGIAYFDTVAVT
jgi:hypothetical protein